MATDPARPHPWLWFGWMWIDPQNRTRGHDCIGPYNPHRPQARSTAESSQPRQPPAEGPLSGRHSAAIDSSKSRRTARRAGIQAAIAATATAAMMFTTTTVGRSDARTG
jgi:hypothetical protein